MSYPDEAELRAFAFLGLPQQIPAAVIMQMTADDLDDLAVARSVDEYWQILNRILDRIRKADDEGWWEL